MRSAWKKALLSLKDIDDGARTDFESGIGGLQRAFGRQQSLAQGLNLADSGDDRTERIFGLANHQALGLIQGFIGQRASCIRPGVVRTGQQSPGTTERSARFLLTSRD